MEETAKILLSAIASSGLTLLIFYKFGEKLLLRHLEHKYVEKLETKKASLQKELEETKNSLSASLNLLSTTHKAELEVLTGQRAKYLERKIDCILSLNKKHVRTARELASFADWASGQASDALMMYSGDENVARERATGTEYSWRMNLVEKNIVTPSSMLESYKNLMILNLPILPTEFSQKEILLYNEMTELFQKSHFACRRVAGLIAELDSGEEGMSFEEITNELKEKSEETASSLKRLKEIESNILIKAIESRKHIEDMLHTNKDKKSSKT